MTKLLLIVALLATAFWVYSIVDCAVQPSTRHRGVSKPIWLVIVIVLPVFGGVLWFVVGRTRTASLLARRAPDDDPEFLNRLGSSSDQDERIRRLEEELAQLDAEADDPRWTDGAGRGLRAAEAPGAPATGSASPTGQAVPPADPPAADGDDDARGQRGAVG